MKNKRYYFGRKRYPGGGELGMLASNAAAAGLDAFVPGAGQVLSAVVNPIIAKAVEHKQISEGAQQAYDETLTQGDPYNIAAYGGDLFNEDHTSVPNPEAGLHIPFSGLEEYARGGWIQKAAASIKRRGTEGKCTGGNFGSDKCPPGSKAYNLAKTFKKMAKSRKKAYGGDLEYEYGGGMNETSMEDAYSFMGNSHEEGGIDVSEDGLPTDQPHAEIEGDEVIVNFIDSEGEPRKYVFSKRLTV